MTDLSRGGSGIARDETGQVYFIPFTTPGDKVLALPIERKKRYVFATLAEILEPSPIRSKPRCPSFGKCGGCEWQHIPYGLQWQTKLSGVLQALKRVGLPQTQAALTHGQVDEFPARAVYGYRNRIQLRGEGDTIGYFARGTHTLVGIEGCDIARPEINSAITHARGEGKKLPHPYKVELSAEPDGKVTFHWNCPHGAHGFRQVHDAQNEELKLWISSNLPENQVLYDLYGGSGNLSSGLAGRMREIHCVDLNTVAGSAGNVHFHRSSVLAWLPVDGI